jgi:tripartite-type tricarboxylate transporter receptor subunit TctC
MGGRSSAFTVDRRVSGRALCVLTVVLFAVVAAQPASSAGVEDFYKGKTISLLIGYSVGGGYDTYGRLVARHLGKHIPGNPIIVPQNMTGAGSLKAANYLYSVAPSSARSRGARASPRSSTKPSLTAQNSLGSAALPTR